jgi:hypothetical protein
LKEHNVINNNFYTPEEVRPLYCEIVPAYQKAFTAPPWNEVSKCVDEQARCDGGLSSIAIGSLCNMCGLCPVRPAYEADELTERFDALGSSRPTAWYAEQNVLGFTMGAVAWRAQPSAIAIEKYADVPEMSDWIIDRLADEPVMWLDEVFANRQLKPKGNLQNFGKFVMGLAAMLDCENVAYRTIEPRMTAVPKRDFGDNAIVLTRKIDVPDRREFVMINNIQETL